MRPGSTLSDASGNYTFSSLPSGGNYTVTPTKAARVPGSANINTVDVIATQRHFLNLGTPLSGCRLTAADVNGDTRSIQLMSLPFSDSSSASQPGSPILESTSSLLRAAPIRGLLATRPLRITTRWSSATSLLVL